LLIYLPEVPFEFEEFSKDLAAAFNKNPNVVICVSEGIADSTGHFICEYSSEAQLDTFGHKMLTGCGEILENYIRNQFGVKVRSIELNVSQRCSGMVVSATDVEEAAMAGIQGVQAALCGHTGEMVAFSRQLDAPYTLAPAMVDVNEVCNKEKTFPKEWITEHGTDIGPEFLTYALPLIKGEVNRKMEHGVPVYCYRTSTH
ncbi:MAG: 6-phosphofructokinase, partial [Clostridium sp.]